MHGALLLWERGSAIGEVIEGPNEDNNPIWKLSCVLLSLLIKGTGWLNRLGKIQMLYFYNFDRQYAYFKQFFQFLSIYIFTVMRDFLGRGSDNNYLISIDVEIKKVKFISVKTQIAIITSNSTK